MDITKEEKADFIKQLETLYGERPYFYLKFCQNTKYAEDICNGNLYANTSEFFREAEIKSGERGQGDQFELTCIIEVQETSFFNAENGETFMTAPEGTLKIRFEDDDAVPIISFVGIPLADMDMIYVDETHADFIFPFSDEEYNSMKENFGEYCVIIDALELKKKVANYTREQDCDYIFDKVEYCEVNRLDRINVFNERAKERFLYKNKDLHYQREYRLVFAHEMTADHYIKVGKLENAKILKSSELSNIKLCLEYISQRKKAVSLKIKLSLN